MTPEIILVLVILIVAVILLITEWIPMEVTALLSLGAVTLTGLVTPGEALTGFSNPAVVTIWAVFILSGGLTRTGVANAIGRFVLRLAGNKETRMILVIMVSAGVMSAIMNNVAVAALMLPVVMDIARHTGSPPSRLLIPLAYGSLLGGLTTQIGTPPNILVSEVLRDAELRSFSFFDFTPIGLVIMFCGVVFMVFIGRHFLPRRDVAKESTGNQTVDWEDQYDLDEQLFNIRIPRDSLLIKKTLAESRLGSTLGWNVIGIIRNNQIRSAPGPSETLQAGDQLTVEGRIDNLKELKNWRQLIVEESGIDIEKPYSGDIKVGEIVLAGNSPFVSKTLNSIGFRGRFEANVLAIRRSDGIRRTHLQDIPLERGDVLLMAGRLERLEDFKTISGFEQFRLVSRSELIDIYHLHERLMALTVPPDSAMIGKTLKESRLGESLGSRVLGILRGNEPILMPEPWETLQANDRLVVEGRLSDFEILQELEKLIIERRTRPDIGELVSGNVGLMEAILSPHTRLVGKTLRQLNFREKHGLSVLSVWREGKAYRANLRDMALRFGDALLLFGPRDKLRMLGREPDFIVLTETAQEELRLEKMKFSVLIMGGILLPVIIGWVPVYIAAVIGAALMVLFGCLSMDEAYRQIEWKAVFLIAGLLPLGTALDQTGAARLIAEGVVTFVGPFGPQAVMLGLVALTFLATCFVPTAALVVLMAPIVLNTSTNMGLSPYAFMMAIAMAASASFMTPISHPANILVMGPGGYRFMDYFKVGGLLTVVVLLVIIFILPVFWPLTP
ncbi:MAG: SLC13 family permease [Desulfobacterales bacterium]|nr:SLC13 family permease [Desulfobacterales bacterium]MDH3876416.1 SLC13 family permease [Desulfobacterales bacterium]